MSGSAGQDRPIRREVVSFARRDGRLSHRHQQAWDAHHARYVVDPPRAVRSTSLDPSWRLDAEAEFGRRAPLVVEIGSGDGDAVLDAAEANPGDNVLAVEVYRPGLARTIVGAESRGLSNLRVLAADARALVAHGLDEGSVSELRVFFPDPWPKARHHKRRLVDAAFVADAARVLHPGGVLHLATDWADYAQVMREVCASCPHLGPIEGEAGERGGRSQTRFERKGLAAGRTIVDLRYVRRPTRR